MNYLRNELAVKVETVYEFTDGCAGQYKSKHTFGARNSVKLKGRSETYIAHIWLPNYEEFFFSLGRLLESCEESLSSPSIDSYEFLFRRLDEYERTFLTFVSRFVKSFGHIQSQQNLLSDLLNLLQRTSSLRSHFERFSFLREDQETRENERFATSVKRLGLKGRPRLAISSCSSTRHLRGYNARMNRLTLRHFLTPKVCYWHFPFWLPLF